MPVFFISSANIQNNRLTLDGLLYSHLAKSLRVRKGEIIQVNDEHKQRYVVRVTQVTNQALIGEVEKLLSGPSDEKPSVTLVQSILRGPNMVWAIQKATELGVGNIIPVITERVKSRSDIRSISHLHDRWEKDCLGSRTAIRVLGSATNSSSTIIRGVSRTHTGRFSKVYVNRETRRDFEQNSLFS